MALLDQQRTQTLVVTRRHGGGAAAALLHGRLVSVSGEAPAGKSE